MDAILSPEWLYRYYSFNQHWSAEARMASMRDGCGSHWFLVWRGPLAFLKVYDKELGSRALPAIPSEYSEEATEPAFTMDHSTLCSWWDGTGWQGTNHESELLGLLTGGPEDYASWAEEYFELRVPVPIVRRFFAREPLTQDLVAALNPELSLAALEADLQEIGYP